MGQIIKSVCGSLSVYPSVGTLLVRISLVIFTKSTEVRTPKRKRSSLGGQYRTAVSSVLPKTPILGQELPKTMQILCNPISALYVRESPKFSHLLLGNRGRGTRW